MGRLTDINAPEKLYGGEAAWLTNNEFTIDRSVEELRGKEFKVAHKHVKETEIAVYAKFLPAHTFRIAVEKPGTFMEFLSGTGNLYDLMDKIYPFVELFAEDMIEITIAEVT